MKFALGVFAILQLTTLPGLLLTRHVRFDSRLTRLMGTLVTSLLANYAAVLLLTSIDQYRTSSVWLLITAELAALGWMMVKQRQRNAAAPARLKPSQPMDAGAAAAAAVSLLALAVHGWLWSAEWCKVFQTYDAVASWNRWAGIWAGNAMPVDTATYPQLLPVSWSLLYLIVGGPEGELFARMLMGVFPALILGGIFTLQQRLRQPWLAAGTLTALLLLRLVAEGNRFDGMADVPAAALGFVGVCFLILAREEHTAPAGPWLLLAAAALGAGCATKQAGLMIAALALVWTLTDARLRSAARGSGKAARWALLLVIACGTHWQIIGTILARSQQDAVLVGYLVQDMHEGRDSWQRILHGLAQVQWALAPAQPFGLVILACLAASLAHALGRRVLLFFALPYFLVWCLAFSYDTRNLAASLPFAALSAGFGACVLAGRCRQGSAWLGATSFWPRVRPWLPSAAITLIFLAALRVPDDSLSALHRAARRRAGDAEMNRAVAAHMGKTDTALSAYLMLSIQPGISKRVINDHTPLPDAATADAKLRGHRWLVVESNLPPAHEAVRRQLVSEGRLKETARTPAWVLYQISEAKASSPPP